MKEALKGIAIFLVGIISIYAVAFSVAFIIMKAFL